MERIYFDNAATTPLEPRVLEAMMPYMTDHFGNPSSTHAHGRVVRSAIEKARKKVAEILNASPSEIFFTSGGTEADNTAICSSITQFGLKNAITSPTEHHAVLHTMENEASLGRVNLNLVRVDHKGRIDLNHLEELLKSNGPTMVSIMHANNEIGTKSDVKAIAEMVHRYGGLYHSDTVQTMAHYRHDVKEIGMDFLVGSAHKFHGPKGVGFIYISADSKIPPYIHGGAQERNMRGGTENVIGIVALAKALELAYEDIDEHQSHVQGLKTRMMNQLMEKIPGVTFNGNHDDPENSLYTVLNLSLPESDDNDMLLFNLDLRGISCSAGSACTSGSNQGSHVLEAIGADPNRAALRFSFSKFNTVEEVDRAVNALVEIQELETVKF